MPRGSNCAAGHLVSAHTKSAFSWVVQGCPRWSSPRGDRAGLESTGTGGGSPPSHLSSKALLPGARTAQMRNLASPKQLPPCLQPSEWLHLDAEGVWAHFSGRAGDSLRKPHNVSLAVGFTTQDMEAFKQLAETVLADAGMDIKGIYGTGRRFIHDLT